MKPSGAALAIALAAAVVLAAAAPTRGRAEEPPRVVRIVAKRFSYTPSEITVKKGEPVVLELVSEDRLHGFNVPAFRIRTDVRPHEVTRVPLTPDTAGTFPFHCDVFCGDGHEDMTGTLVVTE
ncbi:MAG TPA: cupredoxin domain-containing protein [Thermoanaerobaculia bacterium]|nr:cupredoxin domain-containing protein [Thermoanaerobaculia bacterium]